MAFKAAEADCIVTVGGGSAMDTAKAIGIIINNPEFADVRSLEGVAPTTKHAVFTIAVPTTAGTAAEVTINYVITDVEKVRKFVCVDTNDAPEVAVVDPEMMATMPAGLTASTGMDALTHAIEGYTTKGAWELTDMFHPQGDRAHLQEPARRRGRGQERRAGLGPRGHGTRPVHRRHGLLQRGSGHRPRHGRTRSRRTTTPRTVWPALCSCRSPWSSTSRLWLSAWPTSPVAMGVDTTGMTTDEAADAAIAACASSPRT